MSSQELEALKLGVEDKNSGAGDEKSSNDDIHKQVQPEDDNDGEKSIASNGDKMKRTGHVN